jgi:hypothetical protein
VRIWRTVAVARLPQRPLLLAAQDQPGQLIAARIGQRRDESRSQVIRGSTIPASLQPIPARPPARHAHPGGHTGQPGTDPTYAVARGELMVINPACQNRLICRAMPRS